MSNKAYKIPDMHRTNKPAKPPPTVKNQLDREYRLINTKTGRVIAVSDKLTTLLRVMGHPPAGKVYKAIQSGEPLEYNGSYRFEAAE